MPHDERILFSFVRPSNFLLFFSERAFLANTTLHDFYKKTTGQDSVSDQTCRTFSEVLETHVPQGLYPEPVEFNLLGKLTRDASSSEVMGRASSLEVSRDQTSSKIEQGAFSAVKRGDPAHSWRRQYSSSPWLFMVFVPSY